MTRKTPLLGLSERWSLARNNVGTPITVVYHASLPAGLITKDELEGAVQQLCDVYAILLCNVDGRLSSRPAYRVAETIRQEELVKVLDLDPISDLSVIVDSVIKRGTQFDVSNGPLWEIQLHKSQQHDTADARDRLILLIDHILCDGVGARNLFTDLLCLLSDTPIPPQSAGLPARMDNTVDLTPDSIVNAEQSSTLDSVRAVIQRYNPFAPTRFPLKLDPAYDSLAAAQQFDHFELPQSELTGLLSIGKNHNIPTVHPVIHIASLAALYRATASSSSLSFTTSVPISERKEDLGHPRSTGNYVTFHYATDTINPSTPFWDTARALSTTLRKPETKVAARRTLGKFSLIDKPDPDGAGESGWEGYLYNLINDPSGPHKLALAVSNVGRMDVPIEGKLAGLVQEVYFQQSASAVGAAIVVSIVSARGGPCGVSISSKRGSLPPGVFEAFIIQLKAMLSAVARGDVGISCRVGDSIPGVPEVD